MKYKIYPTLHSEIRKGTVWTYFKTNSNLIKIKNSQNGKYVVISHREIDSNFIKEKAPDYICEFVKSSGYNTGANIVITNCANITSFYVIT